MSFNARLPYNPTRSVSNDYHRLDYSSQSTGATPPPVFATQIGQANFIEREHDHWTLQGSRYMESHKSFQMTASAIPPLEAGFFLKTEADVVRATALYLLHPINQAINAYRLSKGQEALFCSMEVKLKDARTDVLWRNQTTGRYVAVLELKNTYSIKPEQFSQSIVTDLDLRSNLRLTTRIDARRASQFKENALVIISQAAKYAVQFQTPWLAVFDWRRLVVVYFPNLDLCEQWCGAEAVYEEFNELDTDVPVIRKAFFTWLMQASRHQDPASTTSRSDAELLS